VTPWVTQLIVANIAFFILTAVSPNAYDVLALVPIGVLQRPWTLVTYMFLHAGFMHLFFNMIGLFFFGPRLESRLGGRDFLLVYMLSGIAGALLTFIFTPQSAVVGASGAVLGVLAAYARIWPEERIYIWGILPVTARVMVIGLAVVSVASGFSRNGSDIAHFAHLGGLGAGWLFMMWRERRRKPAWGVTQPSVVRSALGGARSRRDRWQAMKVEDLHIINRTEAERILMKLRDHGEASLTIDEQQFLDRFSRE
jgi:membrane associated rhomboid family serine protease